MSWYAEYKKPNLKPNKNHKAVDYTLFVTTLMDYATHRNGITNLAKFSEKVGLSVPAVEKRANAIMNNEVIPETWFTNIPEGVKVTKLKSKEG